MHMKFSNKIDISSIGPVQAILGPKLAFELVPSYI